MSSATSSTTKTNFKSEYLQPTLAKSYDSSLSPLALLAQTCSSIGQDCPLFTPSLASTTSPTITSLPAKLSTNSSNSDKSFSLIKRSSPSQANCPIVHKKSTVSLKTNIVSTSPAFIEPCILSNSIAPLCDPNNSLTALLLRSSFSYIASHQHLYSSSCIIPGCLQCETVRRIASNSASTQPYESHSSLFNPRLCLNDESKTHPRYSRKASKVSHHHRSHPYFNPSRMIDIDDQLPFFYPHLSL